MAVRIYKFKFKFRISRPLEKSERRQLGLNGSLDDLTALPNPVAAANLAE